MSHVESTPALLEAAVAVKVDPCAPPSTTFNVVFLKIECTCPADSTFKLLLGVSPYATVSEVSASL